jgi:hypothetical protein
MLRRWVVGRWKIGLIDIVLHSIAGLLIGKWWLQWIPDILLPVLLVHGFVTNRLMTPNIITRAYRLMHTIWIPVVLLMMSFVAPTGLLGIHWFVHVVIDQFTHPEPQFQKRWW